MSGLLDKGCDTFLRLFEWAENWKRGYIMKENEKVYYAHSKGSDKRDWEPLLDHLERVAERCEKFANVFGCEGFGRIAGLLHDIGKYTQAFIERLEGKRVRVDHSSAGAKEANRYLKDIFAPLLQFVIAGHHAGLQNYGTQDEEGSVASRLMKDVNDYSDYSKEVTINAIGATLPTSILNALKNGASSLAYSFFFFIKMLFSCLVDADFLETEIFMDQEKSENRGIYPPIKELLERFNEYMANDFKSGVEKTIIDENRESIRAACLNKAKEPPSLFSLTVPTGGGKTLSSMAFALKHAAENSMDRIIYVIPYTSIIEQTAEIFKEIFGAENVLEHHCNFEFQKDFDYENDQNEDVEQKALRIKLATENWDVPIIVTTNVQFFESIYSNKTSKSRKLHNIANAVIILDEAQLLPPDRLKPSLECLCELADNYHSSVVFCTATQPAIEGYLRGGVLPREIVTRDIYDPEVFRRVKYEDIGRIDVPDLAALLCRREQVLCVVNSKKLARKIFESLPKENRYHLSGNMCPAHRSAALAIIKNRLKAKKPVRVVTTQLIEAGVDISFPVVFRQIAGIDSIIQAAGRCNREKELMLLGGKMLFGEVFIFDIIGETLPKGFLSRSAEIGRETIRRHCDEIDSAEAIAYYFETLYAFEDLDKDHILRRIQESARKCRYPFRSIAEDFKLIKNDTVPIIIPYDDEAKAQIDRLVYAGNDAARKLQKYTVNVYGSAKHERAAENSDFRKLMNSGGIRIVADIYYVLNIEELGDDKYYSESVGLRFEGNEGIWD